MEDKLIEDRCINEVEKELSELSEDSYDRISKGLNSVHNTLI